MPFRFGRLLLPAFILVSALIAFFVIRRNIRAAFGPQVALCPGPDHYGYTCESGEGYAYLDATNDTFLYEDDGVTRLELPFPFLFYGTSYGEVHVSSNGNVQFGSADARFGNECMNEGPVVDMGDMIAPFWDDLDLRFFGFLEYETFGTAPNRVFVIEWDDIPRFGDDSEARVTFEVQLFEQNYDLVFLYEDVTTVVGYNGSSATIGLQSEAQGLAMQYGCFQPVVANASRILFAHPDEPNEELGLDALIDSEQSISTSLAAKGHVAELIEGLEQMGPTVVSRLRNEWLNQVPGRFTEWRWLDLTGNGLEELALLWRGHPQNPELAQIVVLSIAPDSRPSLLVNERLSTRLEPLRQVTFAATADLTHDGNDDLLLLDRQTGWLGMVSMEAGDPDIFTVPERCDGRLVVKDSDDDDRLEIIRDGCGSGSRASFTWNGSDFVSSVSSVNESR